MSTSSALSPLTPFLKTRKLHNGSPNRTFNFNPIRLSHKSNGLTFIHGVSGSPYPRSSPLRSSSSSFYTWISIPCPVSDRGTKDFKIKATQVPESDGETVKLSSLRQTLQLGFLFGISYLLGDYFNFYYKQTLKAFPYPVTITTFQFVVGSVFVLLMWTLDLYKIPKITTSQLLAILPLALAHTMGNLIPNMNAWKVLYFFTPIVEAMEPIFSALLSSLFFWKMPMLWVVLSLLPIVGGVALVSMTDDYFYSIFSLIQLNRFFFSFKLMGITLFNSDFFKTSPVLWREMASSVTLLSRNVLSKKFMAKKEASLDSITLFSIITIMSLFLAVPVALFMEGVKFTPSYLQAAGLDVKQVFLRALIAGLCFHSYQQVSYMILQRVSPVTHSVGNCVKPVVVLITSAFLFKAPSGLLFEAPNSKINYIGTGIALAGIFLYSRVKSIKPRRNKRQNEIHNES